MRHMISKAKALLFSKISLATRPLLQPALCAVGIWWIRRILTILQKQKGKVFFISLLLLTHGTVHVIEIKTWLTCKKYQLPSD